MDNITADSWLSDPDGNLKNIKTNWEKIPELGVTPAHLLKDGQLVRFRGMIQDMADPVIYLSRYEVLNESTGVKELRFGKYRDVYLPCKDDELIIDDSDNCKNGDRRAYYCVSIPGLNPWALKKSISNHETDITMKESKGESSSHPPWKRSADEMEIDSTDKKITSPPLEGCKRISNNTASTESALQINLNFPIEEQENYSCVVNLYDEEDGCLRLNEVIDVVGFVSFCCGADELDHLPPSLVPRLHAVHFNKVLSSNPHFSSSLDHSDIINRAEKIRSDLLLALTQLMLGDSLAAEYLLCNLISRIYKRQDVITLGKFCMNISNVPIDGNYPQEIYNVIKKLVPKSHYLPLSLEKMNSKKFIPVKYYENNRLNTGILQLSDNTHLVLDETKLQTGKLVDNGVHNVKALENIISFQKLKCDFKFNEIEYPVDIPVIVISDGKSILSHDVRVVLKSDSSCTDSLEETYAALNEYLKEPLLTDIRRYLTVVSHQEFDLTESLIGTIQEDYVKLRQTEKNTSEFDLHTLLVLSRLLCLSCGQTSLSKEMWDKAFSMENERKTRVREISPPQRNE